MPRPGELSYFERIGEVGRRHALAKPFSDPDCGVYLQRVGALFSLLPPPPARILECGCGTGWLAHFLAKAGYQVTATDVAPDAIHHARENPMFGDAAPQFLVADSEELPFDSEFDAVVFFDSLHHSIDERAALRAAHRALRPGGICIPFEPGRGHHRKSLSAEAEFDVTEKDMPPSYVRRLGREVGFRSARVYPSPQILAEVIYADPATGPRWHRWLRGLGLPGTLLALLVTGLRRRSHGVAVLYKDLVQPDSLSTARRAA